jgi:tetratricopeptide (TPR) repeat protein
MRALLILLVMSLAVPAHALDWNELKKSAQEYSQKAEKKVDEWVSLARSKWAEFRGDKAEAPRAVASDAKPVQDSKPISTSTSTSVQPSVSRPVAAADQVNAIGAPISRAEKEDFKKLIEQTKTELKTKDPVTVAAPGRKGATVLPATKAGVPKFDLVKNETKKNKAGKKTIVKIVVKDIPKLDIGEEKTISKTDLVPANIVVGLKKIEKAKPLPGPERIPAKEISRWTQMKVAPLQAWKGIDRSKYGVGEIVTQQKVDAVKLDMVATNALQAEKPVARVTENELKMLGALILNKKGDKCHLVSGLYHDLAKDKDHAEEANFLLGVCSHQMGFHSEAVKRLIDVIVTENPDYTPEAVRSLVEDLPREFDRVVADTIKGIKKKSLIPDKAKDDIAYVLARTAHKRDQWNEAAEQSLLVKETSKHYANARFMHGIALYGQGKGREAEKALEDLRSWLAKKKIVNKNLETLIAVNLARIRFTQKRYQAAHEEYMKTAKDHPLWVQALIEQGWTQLFTDDAPGAIGNMYSLHSPYFKSVFMPESWVVRTIGYIDICQYGDSYRTLTKLEQLHSSQLRAINDYLGKNKSPEKYYDTVRSYIKGRSDAPVDGLPSQVVREIARQRGFLNVQESLNAKEDEIAQYKFVASLIVKDQAGLKNRLAQAKARLVQVNANLKKAATDPTLTKNLNEWNAQKRNETTIIKNYEFQVGLFEQGRTGFNGLRGVSNARLDAEKNRLRVIGGKELMQNMVETKDRLAQVLEGNEFLRYEIFAGSGENIRYQVAGGATTEGMRIPANVKPQKILNWEFDGEYWEDEIGSYRSTLKNNCPKNPRAAAAFNTTGN